MDKVGIFDYAKDPALSILARPLKLSKRKWVQSRASLLCVFDLFSHSVVKFIHIILYVERLDCSFVFKQHPF